MQALESENQVFSLEKIKTPAFLLNYEGVVLAGNKEALFWLDLPQDQIVNCIISNLIGDLGSGVLSEIHHLPPGKSLLRDISSGKISFFPTRYDGNYAILALASIKDPEYLERLEKAKEESLLPPRQDTSKRPTEKKKNSESPDAELRILLGDLARMAVHEEKAEGFLLPALEKIRQSLEASHAYLEQVAHGVDEIPMVGETIWTPGGPEVKSLQWIAERSNPMVLETRNRFLLSDQDWIQFQKETGLKRFPAIKPTVLLLPLLFQKEPIAILGLIWNGELQPKTDFEYRGLTIADLLGQILIRYRRQYNEWSQSQRIKMISEQQHQACWSVSANGNVTFFNQAFIDAVVSKGASFGTRITYPRQKSGQPQTGFSDWEEEYNKAFTGERLHFQWQSADAQGNIFTWDIKLVPMQGSLLGYDEVLGMAVDISKEQQQQSAIQMHQTQYMELIDAFEDVYFQADTFGNILSISSGIEKLTGFDASTFRGSNLAEFLFEHETLPQNLVELREGKRITGVELAMKDIEGKEVWLICNLKPRHSPWSEWMGFEGIARDHSAMRKAQWNESKSRLEATDALKVKERFLANISHEIRTPLNGVLGMAQLLKETGLTLQQAEYLQVILKSGDALLHILNQLIDLSSAETGKIVLKGGNVHMPDLLNGVTRLYADQARLKNIGFFIEIHPALQTIYSDENRLHQLVNNFLSNAFKFTVRGHIKLKALTEDVLGKPWVRLEVTDTGCGLSTSEQLAIQQLIQSENPEYAFQATRGGLGLLTSKLITDALQGQLGFVSAPGSGATFWVRFPMMEAEEEEEQQLAPEEKTIHFENLAPEVLLVDDNAVNLKVAYEILVKAGCKVVVATNGEEAVEKTKTGFFHVILMDIQMPVMDGVTATQVIKNLDLGYIPAIVAMTAYCLKEDKRRFVEAGMDDFIAKPISGDKILSKVKYWTEKSYFNTRYEDQVTQPPKPVLTTIKSSLEEIFDFSVLRNLNKHLGEDILIDSIEEFAKETEAMVLEMSASLLMSDWATLRSHAHTLKGNAGTFGVNQLSALARDLENELKNDNLAAAQERMERLAESARQFLSTYQLLNKNHDWKN